MSESSTRTPSAGEERITISKEMTIEYILSLFPQKAQRLAQEITNAGLHCIGCGAATWETLEAGMYTHGKTPEEIQDLLDRLNALLGEEQDLSTISLTPRAATQFLKVLKEENKIGWGLRFEEKMSGCNGFEYSLAYSEKATQDDTIYHSNGVDVHVTSATVGRLVGSQIDYIDGLNPGFKISNPNVNSSCHCGSSHGYRDV